MEIITFICLIALLFILNLMLINVLIIGFSFLIGVGLFKLFKLNSDASILLFSMQIVLISLVCFTLTLGIYLIYKYKGNEQKFKQNFEGTYLIIMYISALISVLNALKPALISGNVFKLTDFDFFTQDQMSGFALLLFISLSNYTLFKNLIVEKKVFFIKDEKCKLKCKNYLKQ